MKEFLANDKIKPLDNWKYQIKTINDVKSKIITDCKNDEFLKQMEPHSDFVKNMMKEPDHYDEMIKLLTMHNEDPVGTRLMLRNEIHTLTKNK